MEKSFHHSVVMRFFIFIDVNRHRSKEHDIPLCNRNKLLLNIFFSLDNNRDSFGYVELGEIDWFLNVTVSMIEVESRIDQSSLFFF